MLVSLQDLIQSILKGEKLKPHEEYVLRSVGCILDNHRIETVNQLGSRLEESTKWRRLIGVYQDIKNEL
jgi:hypothetical protein